MHFTEHTRSIIIGGTSGIGKAIADQLKKRPGNVEVASRKTGFDVSNIAAVADFFANQSTFDHVIITAGSSAPGGTVCEVNIDEAKNAFDTKFWGSVAVAKEAAKHMPQNGTITLTSGFLSRRTIPGTYVKTAMNAALEAVTKILAKELGPIRVNIVSPGLTDTDAYATMDDKSRKSMLDNAAAGLPAGKIGNADELAQGYLLAIDNPFITGAVIDISGGALVS